MGLLSKQHALTSSLHQIGSDMGTSAIVRVIEQSCFNSIPDSVNGQTVNFISKPPKVIESRTYFKKANLKHYYSDNSKSPQICFGVNLVHRVSLLCTFMIIPIKVSTHAYVMCIVFGNKIWLDSLIGVYKVEFLG